MNTPQQDHKDAYNYRHLFKLERETYREEGIDWQDIEFEDNSACIALFEGQSKRDPGIFSLLDEECVFPKV